MLGERDAASLARQFRHHSRFGIDVQAPRWDEDLEFVAALVENFANPPLPIRGRRTERGASWRWADCPRWKRRGFERKLDRLRMFVWLREEMRRPVEPNVLLHPSRLLEIARRRTIGDDVFFMTFREIFAGDCSQVESNKAIHESYRNFAAPERIGSRYTYQVGASVVGALRGSSQPGHRSRYRPSGALGGGGDGSRQPDRSWFVRSPTPAGLRYWAASQGLSQRPAVCFPMPRSSAANSAFRRCWGCHTRSSASAMGGPSSFTAARAASISRTNGNSVNHGASDASPHLQDWEMTGTTRTPPESIRRLTGRLMPQTALTTRAS